jgi:CheY-like chemotaxis protein
MRILVAEDDAPLTEFLHRRLLQEKFAVQMLTTGPAAQRYAADQSYDLVALDFKSQWIGWSGCASQHSIEEAGSTGVDGGWRVYGGGPRQRPQRRSRRLRGQAIRGC